MSEPPVTMPTVAQMAVAAPPTPVAPPVTLPQDPKVPAAFEPPPVITVEVDGLQVAVDQAALDDVEIYDMLNELSSGAGELALVPRIMRALFGPQYRKVLDHIRDKQTGRVTFGAAQTFIADTMAALDPNSQRS